MGASFYSSVASGSSPFVVSWAANLPHSDSQNGIFQLRIG